MFDKCHLVKVMMVSEEAQSKEWLDANESRERERERERDAGEEQEFVRAVVAVIVDGESPVRGRSPCG